jgi:hypothetical protein
MFLELTNQGKTGQHKNANSWYKRLPDLVLSDNWQEPTNGVFDRYLS